MQFERLAILNICRARGYDLTIKGELDRSSIRPSDLLISLKSNGFKVCLFLSRNIDSENHKTYPEDEVWLPLIDQTYVAADHKNSDLIRAMREFFHDHGLSFIVHSPGHVDNDITYWLSWMYCAEDQGVVRNDSSFEKWQKTHPEG